MTLDFNSRGHWGWGSHPPSWSPRPSGQVSLQAPPRQGHLHFLPPCPACTPLPSSKARPQPVLSQAGRGGSSRSKEAGPPEPEPVPTLAPPPGPQDPRGLSGQDSTPGDRHVPACLEQPDVPGTGVGRCPVLGDLRGGCSRTRQPVSPGPRERPPHQTPPPTWMKVLKYRLFSSC